MFSLPPCPPLSLKSGSKVNVPFSLLGGTGWPFGLWDSDRLVDPFLLSFIRSLLGVQAFQLVRDGVLFDSVPFLGFFPSKDFNSPLFPLEGLFLFLLRASRTSVCPLGGCFCSRVSRVFLSPFSLAFLDPSFYF